MSQDSSCEQCEEGLPPWVMTFADLMSLLMCFFVLLLSFAELDLMKFKQVAGSMKFAFGVQREIKATEIPKGTSVIAKEYSPGKPTDPTPLKQIRQQTTDENKQNLEFTDAVGGKDAEKVSSEQAERLVEEQRKARLEAEKRELTMQLANEIKKGLVEVQAVNDRVLIRIREKGSFPSGSAKLRPSFYPVIRRIAQILNKREGTYIVAGHTDDVPIFTDQYRSNWDLSSARAATVVHFLTQKGGVNADRLEIRAFADNQPLFPNDGIDNRARNRRVEISIQHGNNRPVEPTELGAPSGTTEVTNG